jgi:hypothetical protein
MMWLLLSLIWQAHLPTCPQDPSNTKRKKIKNKASNGLLKSKKHNEFSCYKYPTCQHNLESHITSFQDTSTRRRVWCLCQLDSEPLLFFLFSLNNISLFNSSSSSMSQLTLLITLSSFFISHFFIQGNWVFSRNPLTQLVLFFIYNFWN